MDLVWQFPCPAFWKRPHAEVCGFIATAGAVLADAYMPFGLLMQGLAEQNENTRLHGACEP